MREAHRVILVLSVCVSWGVCSTIPNRIRRDTTVENATKSEQLEEETTTPFLTTIVSNTEVPSEDVTTLAPINEVDASLAVLQGRNIELEDNELDNAVDSGAVLVCPDPELMGKDLEEHASSGERERDRARQRLSGEVSVAHRPCSRDRDCPSVGEQCCPDQRGRQMCTVGVPPPQQEQPRSALLGLVYRECPSSASSLVEPWPVINCTRDEDCWPRLCCRDAPGAPAFCRTPRPLWERSASPGLRSMLAYLQCTPPPPPVFDLFPKPCRSTFDCFPNLCCQERGRKVCRPPRRSLLALIASVGQHPPIQTQPSAKQLPWGCNATCCRAQWKAHFGNTGNARFRCYTNGKHPL